MDGSDREGWLLQHRGKWEIFGRSWPDLEALLLSGGKLESWRDWW